MKKIGRLFWMLVGIVAFITAKLTWVGIKVIADEDELIKVGKECHGWTEDDD